MCEKVTDFTPTFCSESGQNFKNRGHLYNKLPKFIYRGFNFTFCPYNINFISSCNNDEQQAYYNYNYSKNIVPIVELKYLTHKNCLFSEESVVLCRKVKFNINVTHKYLILFVFDKVLRPTWSAVPPAPKNVSERKFSALIHKIRTREAYPARLRFFPNKEIFAFVLGNRSVINVVYNSDKCSVGFLEHTRRCKFEDEPIHRGTCHIAKFLHKLLRYHLALGLSVAFNLRGGRSVSAFTRSAVNEMREHCFFENFDYLPQCIFALKNLVTEIAPIFPTVLVLLNAQSLVGKRNKTLVTFRNVEMTCLVSLSQSKQFASLGIADITKGHNLVWAWVENLGVLVGHSDSNIKGIRFVVSPARADETFQVLYDEVVCSFVVYHYVLFNLFKGKNKTLTPPTHWHKGFYILTGLHPNNVSISSHHGRLVTVQRYELFSNPARNVNSELTFGRACSELRCRKIAAMRKSLCHNTLSAKSLRVEGCQFVVLNVVGSSPTGHPTIKPVDYQIVSGYFCIQNRPNPP